MKWMKIIAFALLVVLPAVSHAAKKASAKPSAAAPERARTMLTIVTDSAKGSSAEGAEAALAKVLGEQGWQSVSLDELALPSGTPHRLVEEALKGRQPSALELARKSGIPYLLLGKASYAQRKVNPKGVSLTMVSVEVNGKLFKSSDGSLVKAFHVAERSTAPDPLVAQSDVEEKLAGSVAEAAVAQLGRPVRQAATQTPLQAAQDPLIPQVHAAPQQDKIAVVIGIESYRTLPKSEFSRKDAVDMAIFLEALGFPRPNIETITDEHATKSDIEKVLEGWLPNRVKPESTVIVYFSGHGAPEPTTGEAYLVPFDGDPSYLRVTGYPLSRLYDQLAKLPAKKVTVLIDSCFSGTGGRSVLAKGVRSITIEPSIKSAHDDLFVMTSSQGTQVSTSLPEREHGAFTFYFLKALQAGKRDLTEVYEYLQPRVADEAKKQNVEQTPTFNQPIDKARGKFLLWNRQAE